MQKFNSEYNFSRLDFHLANKFSFDNLSILLVLHVFCCSQSVACKTAN